MESRRLKARKIDRLLRPLPSQRPLRLLEVGTGSGVIAHYFATHPDVEFRVSAVDVVDQRVVTDGFEFRLVDGTQLPYDDDSFDVVLSNHVIEHVGDEEAQLTHLREVRRVMAPEGVGYLATPNRWAIIEPHYRLPLLSWLPRSAADRYLRLTGRGEHYDCEPLSMTRLDEVLSQTGISRAYIEEEAVLQILSMKSAGSTSEVIARLFPRSLVRRMRWAMPTLVCRLESPGGDQPASR